MGSSTADAGSPAQVTYIESTIMREHRNVEALDIVAAGRYASERMPTIPIGATFGRHTTPRARARARLAHDTTGLTVVEVSTPTPDTGTEATLKRIHCKVLQATENRCKHDMVDYTCAPCSGLDLPEWVV